MYAVVSLLDEPLSHQVTALWAELRDRCGVTGIYATPFPHFSYHVAPAYDLEQLEAALSRLARNSAPFRVGTAGLGIFLEREPVVYVPVVKSPALTRLHLRVWPRVEPAATGGLGYYHPDRWVPHITLGHGDIALANLPDVIRTLSSHPLVWAVEVNNLAVISGGQSGPAVHMRFDFRRKPRAAE
jgi:hypothetical protein